MLIQTSRHGLVRYVSCQRGGLGQKWGRDDYAEPLPEGIGIGMHRRYDPGVPISTTTAIMGEHQPPPSSSYLFNACLPRVL